VPQSRACLPRADLNPPIRPFDARAEDFPPCRLPLASEPRRLVAGPLGPVPLVSFLRSDPVGDKAPKDKNKQKKIADTKKSSAKPAAGAAKAPKK
jgi:hypothetical protein